MLRANGPPEAEYAMFDISEIELRASEPGRVREHGYQTTAEHARGRLAHLGMTAAVAREVAQAMQPVLSDAYARGGAVRRVARYLSATELFQSEGYDITSHLYRGVFLDLASRAYLLETGRLVVVHEASRTAGVGAEIAATVAEKAYCTIVSTRTDMPVSRAASALSPKA